MRWRKMKNHEYRELVNTLTKIAREYGQTQQLRERIAHALPFDCDVIDDAVAEERNRWALLLSERLTDAEMGKYATSAECKAARDALRGALLDGLFASRTATENSVKIPANNQQGQQ